MRPPYGWAEIAAFAGYAGPMLLAQQPAPPAGWEAQRIVRVPLPAPLAYASTAVRVVAVNRAIEDEVRAVFGQIYARGRWPCLEPYGGGWYWRAAKRSGRLSMHSLGLALDFSPQMNPMRAGIITDHVGDLRGKELLAAVRQVPQSERRWALPDVIVEAFVERGWTWGGEFDDPMHFQFGGGF